MQRAGPAHRSSTIATGWRGARWSWPTAAGCRRRLPRADERGPGWACATASRPARWSAPTTRRLLEPHGVDSWFERIAARHGGLEVGGEWIDRPWDLVARNGAHLERDFAEAGGARGEQPPPDDAGPGRPGRPALDPRDRPDRSLHGLRHDQRADHRWAPNVWVQPFTRIEGPCSIGAETQLFRANLRGCVTIGPNCRIGGEVEAVDRPRLLEQVSRGLPRPRLRRRVGQPGGDHVQQRPAQRLRRGLRPARKATRSRPARPRSAASSATTPGPGMGSMLNTGTAIGVMCNVLPAGILLPKHVPSFTAVLYGRVAPGFPLEQAVRDRPDRDGPPRQGVQRGRGTALPRRSTSRPGSSASGRSSAPKTVVVRSGRRQLSSSTTRGTLAARL